jgi:hypothetical protein
MHTDALPQLLHLGNKLFTSHLVKVGVHSVFRPSNAASLHVDELPNVTVHVGHPNERLGTHNTSFAVPHDSLPDRLTRPSAARRLRRVRCKG